jgi:WXXGXW repeat (2 copies)
MLQWSQQNRRFAKWLSASVVAGACLIASPQGVRTASAAPIVDVRIAPPAPRVEVVPARPSPHHFWVHGYWAWDGHRHVWTPGRYEVQRPGYGYRESHWERAHDNGHWRYHEGGWYRH